jgi:hypothetical protein
MATADSSALLRNDKQKRTGNDKSNGKCNGNDKSNGNRNGNRNPQIPFGDDNKKNRGDSKDEMREFFAALRNDNRQTMAAEGTISGAKYDCLSGPVPNVGFRFRVQIQDDWRRERCAV